MRRRFIPHPLNPIILACLLALGACGSDGDDGDPGSDQTETTQGGDDTSDGGDDPGYDGVPLDDGDGPDPIEDTTGPEPTEDTEEETVSTPDTTTQPVEDIPEPEEDTPEPEEDTPEPEEDVAPEPTAVCGDGVCEPSEACDTCVEDCPACPPGVGDLLITEIMKNPTTVPDAQGEWLEIKNIGSAAVELSGVVLRDDSQDHHVITPETSLVIEPGGHVVLATEQGLGVGLSADYTWADFQLGNAADTVILELDGVLLDAVVYDDGPNFPDPNGASMKLDPSAMTPEANDLGENWCASTTPYVNGGGDKGSPGTDNPECTVCGDGTCETGEVCELCPADCGSCTPCDQGEDPTDETCNGVDDDCDGTLDESTCDDGIDCTEDTCTSSGCSSDPYAHACLIGGTCYLDGDENPANDCQVCDPGVVSDSWASKLFSLGCNDNDSCTNDDLCLLGFCVGSDIQDAYEPNDTKSDAVVLGQIKDDNDFPAGDLTGTLFGEGDSDWYTYFIEDVFLTQFHPRAELSNLPAGNVYQLCVFSTCESEDGNLPVINDCEGGVEWVDPSPTDPALAGCCTTGSDELMLKLSIGCSQWGLGSESGPVHVHVEQLSGDWTCDEYTLTWGDD